MYLRSPGCMYLMVQRVGVQLVIVAFLGHSHSLYKSKSTVLSAKSDSDFIICLQSYQGLIIDRSLVY